MDYPRLTMDQMEDVMEDFFDEIRDVRAAGQEEYAHNRENAFANFQRVSRDLGLDQKTTLWVFAMKHRDGIASFLKGHRSQREGVRGRILDLVMYLILLRGMIEAEEGVGTSPFAESP